MTATAMEGTEGSQDSGGGVEEDEGIDYISSMPVSVLQHILSFLSPEDALRTICIRRFLHLWTSLDALSFSQCNFHRCHNEANPEFKLEFINFVDSVLSIHDRPEIEKFSLSMHIPFPPRDPTPRTINRGPNLAVEGDGPVPDSAATLDVGDGRDVWPYPVASRNKAMWKRISNIVDSWVRFALQKKVKFLDLDFMACGSPTWNGSDCYASPSDVLKSSHLVGLHLDNCRFEQLQGMHLVSLSKLSLVRINLSEKTMDQIMSGCVALKELSLVECRGLKELRLRGCSPLETLSVSFHSLEKIDIFLRRFKSLQARVFLLREINCPRITSLDLYGRVTNVMLSDVWSVGEASLCLGLHFRPCTATYRDIRFLLETLCCRVNHFNPCTWFILIFSVWELTNQPCPFFRWKSVTAALGLTKWIVPGICSLLRRSPFLETLVIYVYPFRRRTQQTFSIAQWLGAYEFEVADYWDSLRDTFPCLKRVKVCGIVTEPYIMKLIEFLLGNAPTLKEMMISLRETPRQHKDECLFAYEDGELPVVTPDMVAECSRKVLGFSRASEGAAIRFV